MKIFPLKPLSNLDRMNNFITIIKELDFNSPSYHSMLIKQPEQNIPKARNTGYIKKYISSFIEKIFINKS